MKKLLKRIGDFFRRIKVKFLFQFRLKPKIVKMSRYITQIATLRQEIFPVGKSLFVFPGTGDIIYFVMLREESGVKVVEVYDELLNKLPQEYNLLKRISLQELLPHENPA